MDLVINEISNWSLSDLKTLRGHINDLITDIKTKEEEKSILDKVEKDGYAISYKSYDLELSCIELPYYVSLTCYDKDDRSVLKISGECDEQPEWTDLITCDYKVTGKEDYEDLYKWDYNDWESSSLNYEG